MEKTTKFNIGYLVIALLAVVMLRDAWVGVNQVQTIPYSEFQHHLKANELEEIAISNNLIQGKLKKPTADGRTRIVTTRVDPDLARDLGQYEVKFSGVVENTFLRDILGWILPALVFFGIWMFLAKRMAVAVLAALRKPAAASRVLERNSALWRKGARGENPLVFREGFSFFFVLLSEQAALREAEAGSPCHDEMVEYLYLDKGKRLAEAARQKLVGLARLCHA